MNRFLFIAGFVLIGLAAIFYFSSAPADINAMITDGAPGEDNATAATVDLVIRAVNVLIGAAGLVLAALGFRKRGPSAGE